MQRTSFLGVLGFVLVACGPSYGGQGAKTPEQIVEEQEKLEAEQEKQGGGASTESGPAEETALEKRSNKFDKKQAEIELKRAARSAETCGGVVNEKGPTGTAKVSITFKSDGHVKDATIDSTFADTPIGKCALRAMKAVIVPRFEGSEVSMDWELDFSGKKKSEKENGEKEGGEGPEAGQER